MNISMESLNMLEHRGCAHEPEESPKKRLKHPDVDGGWGWMVMISAFFIQFIAAGTIMCYGVLYVEFLDYFGETRARTSWIGSVNITIFSVAGFIASVLSNRFSHRVTIILGSLIATVGVISGAHCPNIYLLLPTYGIIGGLGMGLCWVASVSLVGLYFQKRRSFAVGFSMCGGGVGFLVFPKMMDFLIETYTWRGALYIVAGLWLNGCVCGAVSRPLPSLKLSKSPKKGRYDDHTDSDVCEMTLLKKWTFYVFCLAQVFWNIGLIVFLYILPDFARLAGHGKQKSSMLLSILGALMAPSRIFAGLLADHRSVDVILFMAVITGTMGITTAIFPVSTYYAVLGVLSAVMGVCQGVVIMGVPLVCVDVFGPKRLTSAFGYLQVADGFGSLVAPPLAGYVFDATGSYFHAYLAGGLLTVAAGFLFFLLFLYTRGYLCKMEMTTVFDDPTGLSNHGGREIIPLNIPKIRINDESPDPDELSDPGFKGHMTSVLTHTNADDDNSSTEVNSDTKADEEASGSDVT